MILAAAVEVAYIYILSSNCECDGVVNIELSFSLVVAPVGVRALLAAHGVAPGGFSCPPPPAQATDQRHPVAAWAEVHAGVRRSLPYSYRLNRL